MQKWAGEAGFPLERSGQETKPMSVEEVVEGEEEEEEEEEGEQAPASGLIRERTGMRRPLRLLAAGCAFAQPPALLFHLDDLHPEHPLSVWL